MERFCVFCVNNPAEEINEFGDAVCGNCKRMQLEERKRSEDWEIQVKKVISKSEIREITDE